jgi:hypothetical protein
VIRFRVLSARAEAHAAAPTVAFTLRAEAPRRVHAIALQTQIRIDPVRRRHDDAEQRGMAEIFGDPSRWGRTQRSLLWAEVSRVVPAFDEICEFEMLVGCTYDLDLASTKYLHALRGGVVPLTFLFRGSVFTEGEHGLAVSMLPWDREASFDLPVETWRGAMDAFFPDQGWLRLRRDVLDALLAYKARHAHATWEAVMRELLAQEPSEVTP